MAKRGEVAGWSSGASRRNRAFLYSVNHDRLTGQGFAFTLTLRDCPPTPEEFHRLRVAWLKRVQRLGAIRWHWVIEMQRRGVPHLHAAVYFPPSSSTSLGGDAVEAWLKVAAPYGVSARAQHVAEIDDSVGWAMYLDKHAARGVSHYQRSASTLPAEWGNRTGRLWGKGGDWPTEEPIRIELSDAAFYSLRRLVRGWVKSKARGDRRKVRFAKRMLRCPDPSLSSVRGVSEWIPQREAIQLVQALAAMGHEIDHH